ncbi:hypothetical protein [Butyricicoccus porcorum]|uniref:DUF4595 domain-containing protein n=1 Tax=Butyricicoccus porcorum TaxID=1945634 RepID=A0A252F6Y7_9FIRM|nr:hypothetical protein [Butyricicoccus porcorum]OUM21548.1 hypothetical protein CBW42_03010 [Butyricicoccus porcorum]
MNVKRIAALVFASCMTVLLAGCGAASNNDTGSAALPAGTPTLEEIYAANTLEVYHAANIQPSLSTCLREGPDNRETNALLTLYWEEDLGLVSRFRKTDMSFRYYFTRDDVNYSAAITEDEDTVLTILADDPEQRGEKEITYAEKLFHQYSFGDYSSKEKLVSCTDSGDTYHIITDISAMSFTDSTGRTYTYTTQEYDVEKETLRILDVFRTYRFTDTDGTVKECTRSRCMTYNKKIVSLPDFMREDIIEADWSRTFTLHYPDGSTDTVAVPDGISVLVQAPDGYEVYADSDCETVYEEDRTDEDGAFPNRTVYLAKK